MIQILTENFDDMVLLRVIYYLLFMALDADLHSTKWNLPVHIRSGSFVNHFAIFFVW